MTSTTSSSSGILPRLTNPSHPRDAASRNHAAIVLGDVRYPRAEDVDLGSGGRAAAGELADLLLDDGEGVGRAVDGIAPLHLDERPRVQRRPVHLRRIA